MQIREELTDLSTSMEQVNNMMKIAKIMIDELAYGTVSQDKHKAVEYINCLASFLHFLIKISEHETSKIEELLKSIQ